jgi:hypothetical protein
MLFVESPNGCAPAADIQIDKRAIAPLVERDGEIFLPVRAFAIDHLQTGEQSCSPIVSDTNKENIN